MKDKCRDVLVGDNRTKGFRTANGHVNLGDVPHVGPSHEPEEPVLDNQKLGIVDDEGVVVVVVEEAQSLGAGLTADFQDGGC